MRRSALAPLKGTATKFDSTPERVVAAAHETLARVRVDTDDARQETTDANRRMIGLGRMGANMVRRLLRGGHTCAVHDTSAAAVQSLAHEGAIGARRWATSSSASRSPASSG